MQLVAVAERTATAELMVPYSPALVPEPLTTRQPDGGEVRDIPLLSTEDGCADTAPKNEAEARTIKRIVVRADMIAIYCTYTFCIYHSGGDLLHFIHFPRPLKQFHGWWIIFSVKNTRLRILVILPLQNVKED